MSEKRIKKVLCWFVLAMFFLSMEGMVVFAQTIIDSPGSQDMYRTGVATEGVDDQTTDAPADTADAGETPIVEDEVAPEPLQVPAAPRGIEFVLVDRYEWHQVPGLAENDPAQGRQGPCGPYAMTSALLGRGEKTTYEQVLKELKPQDLYTTPMEMVWFAIDKGYSARRVENYGVDNLLKRIRETGLSIPCLVNTAPLKIEGEGFARDISFDMSDHDYFSMSWGIQHWVNVVGIGLKDGEPVYVLYKDTGSQWRNTPRMRKVDEFDFRWKQMQPTFLGKALNVTRLAIIMGPSNSADFSDRLASYFAYISAGEIAADGISTAYKSVVAMWGGLQEFLKTGNPIAFLTAASNTVLGVIKTLGGLVGFIGALIGEGVSLAGTNMLDDAKNMWENGGTLGKIAAVPVSLFGASFEIVGGVVKAVSNLAVSAIAAVSNIVVSSVGKFLNNVGKAIGIFCGKLF